MFRIYGMEIKRLIVMCFIKSMYIDWLPAKQIGTRDGRNIDEQLQQTNNEINSVVYAADNAMLCFIDRM